MWPVAEIDSGLRAVAKNGHSLLNAFLSDTAKTECYTDLNHYPENKGEGKEVEGDRTSAREGWRHGAS